MPQQTVSYLWINLNDGNYNSKKLGLHDSNPPDIFKLSSAENIERLRIEVGGYLTFWELVEQQSINN